MTSNAATGYVAKISMLRLKIGADMLRLSSCMLRLSPRRRGGFLGLTGKAELEDV